MDAHGRLEHEIKDQFDRGDLDRAMHTAIEGYGSELYGFLTGLARDQATADDAFAATCEAIWRGLPKFRWQATFRVWAYTIARNEFLHMMTAPSRRETPVSSVPSVQEAIDRVRTATPAHVRTEVKARFAKIRDELAPEDHMLLGLRIDRDLTWSEVAEILGHDAATLRKRFERLKVRLKELLARE
jgi:RNA polymerase sigma-70 factor (ECF subfamily)